MTSFVRSCILSASTTVAGVVLGYFVAQHRAPHLYAESFSPDGGLRAVVCEQSPPFLRVSPHLYRFSVWRVGPGGGPLPGTEAVVLTDSVELGTCRFVWSAGSLVVHTPQSTLASLSATFASSQQWQPSLP